MDVSVIGHTHRDPGNLLELGSIACLSVKSATEYITRYQSLISQLEALTGVDTISMIYKMVVIVSE
jgi:hypothetical protein